MKQKWFSKPALPRIDFSKLRNSRPSHGSGEQNEGIGKLYGDVQSCGYQDVHVMWQLLHQTSSSEVSNLQLEDEDEGSKAN